MPNPPLTGHSLTRRASGWQFSWVLLLGCLLPLTSATQSLAQAPPKYTVSVQQAWFGASGNSPVRVTIETSPKKTVAQDRQFSVVVISSNYGNRGDDVMKAELTIPAGSSSGEVELYVPKQHTNNNRACLLLVTPGEYAGYRMTPQTLLREGLRKPGGNSLPVTALVSSGLVDAINAEVTTAGVSRGSSHSQTLLTKRDKSASLPKLQKLVAHYDGGLGGMDALATMRANLPITGLSPEMLPRHWIGYTSLDRMLISLDDFRRICLENPQQRENIERWVAIGGSLIIFDTGESLAAADKVLPLLLGPDRVNNLDRSPLEWKVADSKTNEILEFEKRDTWWQGNMQLDLTGTVTVGGEVVKLDDLRDRWSSFAKPSEIPADEKFAVTRYLDGGIAIVADDMSGWENFQWRKLEHALLLQRADVQATVGRYASVADRLGVADTELPGFEIPDVGRPPTTLFQILIGAFALIAGPVMFFLLKRTQRMQLLFVVVPLLSFLVCASLLSFAILFEGNNRWGRVQSLTKLDHRVNYSTSTARATYYSGSNPREYVIGEQVIPQLFSGNSPTRFSELLGDQFQISGGGIRARVPHQVVTRQCQPSKVRLTLVPGESQGKRPSIRNDLGGTVELAVIRTADGLFSVENLKPGETAPAQVASESSLKQQVIMLVEGESPLMETPYRYRSYNYIGDFEFEDEHGEDTRVIERLRVGRDFDSLPVNSYIALLKSFPLVEPQIENVDYKLQLHVVKGQW